MTKLLAHLVFVLFVSACGQSATDSSGDMSTPVGHAVAADIDVSVYADALANPARPAPDRERDAGRKPDEVLKFFGIGPGMADSTPRKPQETNNQSEPERSPRAQRYQAMPEAAKPVPATSSSADAAARAPAKTRPESRAWKAPVMAPETKTSAV